MTRSTAIVVALGLTTVALAGCGSDTSRQAGGIESTPASSAGSASSNDVTTSPKWVDQVYGYASRQYVPAEGIAFHIDGVNASDKTISVSGALYGQGDNFIAGSRTKSVEPQERFHLVMASRGDPRNVSYGKLSASGPNGEQPYTFAAIPFAKPPVKLVQQGNQVSVTVSDDFIAAGDAKMVITRAGSGQELWTAPLSLKPGTSTTVTIDNAKFKSRVMFVQDPKSVERRLSSSVKIQ